MAAWRGASAAVSLAAIAVAIKVSLFPAYHSTDFEVHRNWLAITHSLPIKDWYTWSLSPWTLDYPPLFAYFERVLSSLAAAVDPAIVALDNLDYAAWSVVVFQRSSVIVCELPLLFIAYALVESGAREPQGGAGGEPPRGGPPPRRARSANVGAALALLSLASVAFSPGLLLVDHVHFQYNGPLLALLAASLWALAGGRDALGGALFAALVCLKHLFLYPAPLVFVHLLVRTTAQGKRRLARFATLALAVLAVFAACFAPLVLFGGPATLVALAARLFPFDRGLLHTYWAPNAWALYAGADAAIGKAARLAGKLAGRPTNETSSFTTGVLGASAFAALPRVGSRLAALCTLAAQAPCLVATARAGAPPREAPFAALHAALAAFCFGYHVHEKAILTVAVPGVAFALWARDARRLRTHLALSALGLYALLPLIHRPGDALLRLALYALPIVGWIAAAKAAVRWDENENAKEEEEEREEREEKKGERAGARAGEGEKKGERAEGAFGRAAGESLSARARASRSPPLAFLGSSLTLSAYPLPLALLLAGLPALELLCSWVLPFFLGQRLPFLPLLATSLYCGAGVVGIWAAEAAAYAKAAWRGKLEA